MRERVDRLGGIRRTVGVAAAILTVAAMPTTAGAGEASPPPGVISNVTAPLVGRLILPGDFVSYGWDISMPESHSATTVSLSGITATIPLLCLTIGGRAPRGMVVQLPPATVAIAANDTGWHPTSSSRSVDGYQASTTVPSLCGHGLLVPMGNVAYSARLVSTDTTHSFAMRFHAVDAHANIFQGRDGRRAAKPRPRPREDDRPQPRNTNCSSPAQNTGLAQCDSAWTAPSRNTAAAASTSGGSGSGSGGGSGGGSNHGGAKGSARGTQASAQLLVLGAASTGSATSSPGAAPSSAPVPVLALPAPSSRPTVLGPVPQMVPVIGAATSGIGDALPWKWFVLLAVVDLGLLLVVVLRRRRGRDWRKAP